MIYKLLVIKLVIKMWFSDEPSDRSYVVHLREKFSPGPGDRG
jgi:hypothetical protein